jgi:hypothetical protein
MFGLVIVARTTRNLMIFNEFFVKVLKIKRWTLKLFKKKIKKFKKIVRNLKF